MSSSVVGLAQFVSEPVGAQDLPDVMRTEPPPHTAVDKLGHPNLLNRDLPID
jgi:hypothetical protein